MSEWITPHEAARITGMSYRYMLEVFHQIGFPIGGDSRPAWRATRQAFDAWKMTQEARRNRPRLAGRHV